MEDKKEEVRRLQREGRFDEAAALMRCYGLNSEEINGSSGLANLLGSAAGGVVGFAAGGPTGALAGGFVGGGTMDLATGSVPGSTTIAVAGAITSGLAGIAAGESYGRLSSVGVKGEDEATNMVPNSKQSHVEGMMDDVKSLKGNDIRKMKNQADDLTKAKQEMKGNTTLSKRQKSKQIETLKKNHEMHTEHNIHGLTEDRQGQIAADLKTKNSSGRRCAERIIFEDPKRNYNLEPVEYLDNHNYGTLPPKPKPCVLTRAANFLADHLILLFIVLGLLVFFVYRSVLISVVLPLFVVIVLFIYRDHLRVP